jgi:hypothetical protein
MGSIAGYSEFASMSDLATAHSPIVIDRVERSRGDGDAVRLRLGGHRLAVAAGPELDALLVVQVHGRRHRFAASKTKHGDTSPGSWEASFTVPDWAVPVEYGQASLWVGEAAVPVPPVGTRIRVPEPALTAAAYEPAGAAQLDAAAQGVAAAQLDVAAQGVAAAAAEAGRAGPLADALLRETVSALHAELQQRSGREAALDGALERARAELVARTASQAELEATHGELRTELARLVEAVAGQQAEFERRLNEARERSEAELAQARRDSDDARAELSQARDAADRARSKLAHVRDESERARSELVQARDEAERARSELVQARDEADRARAELVGAREQEAGSVHTRQQLAAVNERLAAAVASDQMRAQEVASLREQLAATGISRDAAVAEAGGLRTELSRLGSELAVTREQAGAGDSELGAAQQLLADARALTAQLRGEGRP